MKTSADRRIQSEGRLLYTLLDAADDAGLLIGATATGWRDVKTRIVRGAPFENEAGALHNLLSELETRGALAGTWIEARWRALSARVKTN